MWLLISERDNGVRHGLLNDVEYTVGRKETKILILNDPSISRLHAVLQVSHLETNLDNPDEVPVLTIKDANSKFGTYVNANVRVGPQNTPLVHDSTVTFGRCGSSFRVCYVPLIATTSCVDDASKASLRQVILKLGGHLVSEWRPDCTHLVMRAIKVTIKAVGAMVSLKPIITPDHFTKLQNHWESQANLPNSSMYIPPIDEENIDHQQVSFDVQPERKTIFEGKTFLFLTKAQYKKMCLIISLAGGKAVLLRDDKEVTEDILLNPNHCVMRSQLKESSAPGSQMQLSHIEQILKRNKKRMIPESDVGLAVVYCSVEKYCNPNFDIASTLFGGNKLISQTFSQQEVYAPETQMSTSFQESSSYFKHPSSTSCVRECPESKQVSNSSASGQTSCINMQKENIQHFTQPAEVQTGSKAIKREISKSSDFIVPAKKRLKLESSISEFEVLKSQEPSDLVTIPTVIKQELPSPLTSVDNSMQLDDHQQLPHSPLTSDKPMNLDDHQESHQLDVSTTISLDQRKSACKEDRYLYGLENQTFDDDLPRNLLLVEFAPLLCKKPLSKNKQTTSNSRQVNFKKFRKVTVGKNNFLPCIIGGRDLEVYVKNSTKAMDDWLNEQPESQTQEEEEDSTSVFDWDIQNKGKKRKR